MAEEQINQNKQTVVRIKKSKSGLSKILPSDRLALERQVDALRAFVAEYEANGGKSVTNEKAGSVAKMAPATILVANAFFCDVGILTRNEEGFVPSQEAIAFLKAENGLNPETASEKLKPIFDRQWFSQLLIPRLRLRSMDESEVIKVLGEEANAEKAHLGRLKVLIQYLVFVKILQKEGSQITLANNVQFSQVTPPAYKPTLPPAPAPAHPLEDKEELKDLEKHTLTLEVGKNRKIVIYAPSAVSEKELKRIQQWLEWQFIVTDRSTEGNE